MRQFWSVPPMAQPSFDQLVHAAEALGLGGVVIELTRRLLARRKARRTIALEAAAMAAKGEHSAADLQRALTAATEVILRAHDRDFSALRRQLAARDGEIAELRAAEQRCLDENRTLGERLAVLELARGLPPYQAGK